MTSEKNHPARSDRDTSAASVRLEIHLHGRRLAAIDPNAPMTELLEGADDAQALARLSACMMRAPSSRALGMWLEGCLPENGHRIALAERSLSLAALDSRITRTQEAASVLLANTDMEYPGAVTFSTIGIEPPAQRPNDPGYERLSEQDIATRLEHARATTEQATKRPAKGAPRQGVSLSGQRPKIGLARGDDDVWLTPRGRDLTSWVCKVEQRRLLGGEAGVEAICQRTMQHLGIAAARTWSRAFDGVQTVLSERSDRIIDPQSGQIRARHQEDWSQAQGWIPHVKYEDEWPKGPRWPDAFALLHALGGDPERNARDLMRIAIATWAIGHSDFHRRNLGFLHAPPDQPFSITPAPLYDVSSIVGIERHYANTLALRIGGADSIPKIGPRHWLRFADECGLDRDEVLKTLCEVTHVLPEAIAQAREDARSEDENLDQNIVDRRVERLLEITQRRAQVTKATTLKLYREGRRGLNPGHAPDRQAD